MKKNKGKDKYPPYPLIPAQGWNDLIFTLHSFISANRGTAHSRHSVATHTIIKRKYVPLLYGKF
jgi:hypothetical protein